MNVSPNDSPELTAYALGELSGAQASEIHAMLKACPIALSELEQVEAVTEALRQGAPIPQQRLTPDQRHAILHPTQLPRRMAPMMPRPLQVRKPSALWPAVNLLAKAAAIAGIAGCAFMLGRQVSDVQAKAGDLAKTADLSAKNDAPEVEPAPTVETPPETPKVAAAEKAMAPAVRPDETPKPEVVVVPAAPQPLVAATPAVELAKPSTGVLASTPPAAPKAPAPASANVASLGVTIPAHSDAFINASRRPNDQYELRPANIRPLPPKVDKTQVFSSPAPAKLIAEPKENPKGKTELFIHSWKADVVTCPWNETNRLLRVVIQLPADQPAVIASDNGFPLQVTFDPNNVREYRLLCERHQLAPELRSAGTHVIWYEFQPNGLIEPARELGKLVATVTLPAAHFTTQAIEPFDGTKLRVMDRNQSWQNAREDIVFESSVVGFGMLLRGIPETAKLNHQLVLNLATKAKGTDPSGERARFIRLVQDAKLAAGL